jgi:hypothetical protein
MATLLKVLNNLADIKSAGGVALRVRTQADQRAINIDAKRNAVLVEATLKQWMNTYPNHPVMYLKIKKFMTIGMALASPRSWPLAGMFSVPTDHDHHLRRRVVLTTPGDKREYLWGRYPYYMYQTINGQKTYSQRCYKLVPTIAVAHKDGEDAESLSLLPKWAQWAKRKKETTAERAAREVHELELEEDAAELELIEAP